MRAQCIGGDNILTSRHQLWLCSEDSCDSTLLHFLPKTVVGSEPKRQDENLEVA